MKIKHAKDLLISLKSQISRNLSDEEKEEFLKEFDSLLESCPDYSRAYSEFSIKLLERCKISVKAEYKDVIKSINDIIILFKKKDATKQEFAYAAAAAAVVGAAAYAADAYARKKEHKNQSIDLLEVLKKRRAGRPKGSLNKVKQEKKEQIWVYPRFVTKVKDFINKCFREENDSK